MNNLRFKVNVIDVNDNPPSLFSPSFVAINEEELANEYVSVRFVLKDPDSWALGNGPPFSARLDTKGMGGGHGFKVNYSPGELYKYIIEYMRGFFALGHIAVKKTLVLVRVS